MHARRGVIAACVLICGYACGSSGDSASKRSSGTAVPAGATKPSEPAAKAAAVAAAPASAPATQPPRKPLAERAALEALLERWIDVQNKGFFEAYSSLYATKFQGVKRVGARAFRMQRSTWLADRGRMFKRPMTVRALEPKFEIRPRLATI